MSKTSKNVPPKAPPVAPAKAPVAPAEASTPAPVSSVESTPAATPETSAPPPPPPANQPENLTPPKAPKATPAKETQFVRVRAGNAPVSEGGIIHAAKSEFTIPRTRLPDLADIVTYVADVQD